ncbi:MULTISPECIES: helix-turn-helix domain-containing protein [Chitinophagaceae]
MMKPYESLKETLSFYGVQCNEPYYISSGNPVFAFPKSPFRIDFYAFCICVSGSIHVEIDNLQYYISEGAFLISAPATILKFVSTDSDFRMKLLFFEKNFLLKNISNPFFMEKLDLFINTTFSVCNLDREHAKRLVQLLDYLREQTKREVRFSQDIIRTIIFNLLFEVASVVDSQRTKNEKEITPETNNLFYRFSKLVQENITAHQDVRFYADQLFITSKYLIGIVKRATGKTPHVIIDEYLFKEACILLGFPEKTISQIAFDTGFNSSSSFGRFFKKYASVSPQEYRKRQSL